MLKITDLYNFVDDNTITAVCDQLADITLFKITIIIIIIIITIIIIIIMIIL